VSNFDSQSPRRPGRSGHLALTTALREGRGVAPLAAVSTGLIALINIASALTPDIAWRGHLLLSLEGVGTVRFFHALALPFGTGLLLTVPYLLKRRRRAVTVAVAILLLAGVINLLKGLDFEESIAGWIVAAGLLTGRRHFDVVQSPISLASAIWRVPALGAVGIVLISVADWISHGRRVRLDKVVGESTALLQGHRNGPLRFEPHTATILHHHFQFAWIPLAVHFLEIGTLLSIAYVVFRPLAAPRALPGARTRRLAAEVVRQHGSDTLSFFKLRRDNLYFFSSDRSAFVGYKIDSGVLLLSGDPVGPPERISELLVAVRQFAHSRGLRLGAIGASERLRDLYAEIGLKTMYMGDEAIVETDGFSLEGRAIRKVRQSVNRLAKNGYSAELSTLASLDTDTLAQIEEVLVIARQGRPEIGFSMGMDAIHGSNDCDTLFLVARDGENRVRAFLHFVPCYGRAAVSLSLMRRDPATPNGLMEFLIVHGIEKLKERGIAEVSLNFATGARWIHEPQNGLERLAGKVVMALDGHLQLESLYRFNVKFAPRWEPRYLVFEGWHRLPRTGLAAIWLEGQLPKPRLPRPTTRRRPRYIGEGATAEPGLSGRS
jgi:lysyl-tRNA synthetase class 2